MSHNFVKQFDGSKVCSCCGDERGRDDDRDCPHPIVAQPVQQQEGIFSSVSLSL